MVSELTMWTEGKEADCDALLVAQRDVIVFRIQLDQCGSVTEVPHECKCGKQ